MKKMMCLLLVICLLLAACDFKTPGSNGTLPSGNSIYQGDPELAAQNKYLRWNHGWPLIERENVFYGLLGGRAFYYDRQSGFSDFLCADPSCTHESKDCGSYLEQNADMFTYYDGKLYWLAPSDPETFRSKCLYRCDPDGTNREKVMELDYERIIIGYNPQQWMLHQGKLFFRGDVEVVNGKQAGYRLTFGYIPLDGDEEEVLLYDEFFEQASTNEEMIFWGDTAYYAVKDGLAHTLEILQFNLQDNSRETLLTTDEWPYMLALWATEEGTVYLSSTEALYQVQNGELKEVFSFDKGGYAHLGDGVALTSAVEDGIRTIELRTYTGEMIYQGDLFPEQVEGFGDTLGRYSGPDDYGCVFLGVDTEKLIVCMTERGGMNHVFLLDINNGMKATHLWSGTPLL